MNQTKPENKFENSDNLAEQTEQLKGLNQSLGFLIEKGKEIGKAPQPVKAGIAGLGIGILGVMVVFGTPMPILALATGGVTTGSLFAYVAQNKEDEKRQLDEQKTQQNRQFENRKKYELLQETNNNILKMLNDCEDPEVKSQLLSDFKGNSELMRKLLNDSSSNFLQKPAIEGQSEQTQALPSRENEERKTEQSE